MSESRDLFGKIDALFEKRDPDALLDKGLDHEDFPVLTEMVAASAEQDAQAQAMERRARDRRALERRLGDRRHSGTPLSPRPQAHGEDFEQLVSAVEQRLADLFIRQQLRMEEAVRKAIRDELEKAGKPL
jgi:biopolymer transport protein ExbB/TolQ